MHARLIALCLVALAAAPAAAWAADRGSVRCPALAAPGYCGDGAPAARSGLDSPLAIAAVPGGGVAIVDSGNGVLRRTRSGRLETVAGRFDSVAGLAAMADGSLLFTEPGNNAIKRLDPQRVRTNFAGVDPGGFDGDGGPANAALFRYPTALAATSEGVYVADTGNHRIRFIRADGTVVTVAGTGIRGSAGDGGAATAAQLDRPVDVAVLPGGGFVVATADGRVRRVGSDGVISSLAQVGGQARVAVLGNGDVAIANPLGRRITAVAPDGTRRTIAAGGGCATRDSARTPQRAGLNTIIDLAVDASGALLVADAAAHRVLRIGGGRVTAAAGGGLRARPGCGRLQAPPDFGSRPDPYLLQLTPVGGNETVSSIDAVRSGANVGLGCERPRSPRLDVAIRTAIPRTPRANRPFSVRVDVSRFAAVRVVGAGRSSGTVRGAAVTVRFSSGLKRGRHKLTAVVDGAGQRICATGTIVVR